MNLSRIRNRKSMSKGEMVRQLRSSIKGFDLDETLLTKYESGDLVDKSRISAIDRAVEKTYGLEQSALKKSERIRPRFRIGKQRIAFLSVLALLSITATCYLFFKDHPLIEDVTNLLGALAAIAAIVGVLVATGSSENK